MIASWRGGPRAVANPWRALTLEWQVSSPPPIFNFDAIPTVVGGPYEYGVPGAVHGVFKGAEVPAPAGSPRARPRRSRRRACVKTILVVANETLGGRSAARRGSRRRRPRSDGIRVVVCVPRTNPRQGNIIYDEAVFDAAQVRIDLARKILREEGIEAIGEVGDPDPYTATMDAIAEHHPDEIIISTYPAASSGWLRRDLIERIAEADGRARRARRRRPRPGGPALRRHARGRQPHRRLARAARGAQGARRGRSSATSSSSSCPRRAARASPRARPAPA